MRPRLITAENRAARRRRRLTSASFNEAAAHHRGEPAHADSSAPWSRAASMRPRLITAENPEVQRQVHAVGRGASMRPRLITAENRGAAPRRGLKRLLRFNEAAAHHRGEPVSHFPAPPPPREAQASMRPRLITAENPWFVRAAKGGPTGASMRPRLITAENRHVPRPVRPVSCRFNEAAAHHRGEPAEGGSCHRASRRRFNEAAAHHRGEPVCERPDLQCEPALQ